MTFSFDATKIGEFGLDRMRYEIGDVFVEEPEKTSYLSDTEICAVLNSSSSWKRAKFRLIDSLLHRFGFEVDTKVDSLDLKLSQRVKFWQSEYKRLKAELDAEDISASGALKTSNVGRAPIFRVGMNDWRPRCI